ncbi:MAG: Ldh family oxidoreductase [Aquisalimonadaceae bacterium]
MSNTVHRPEELISLATDVLLRANTSAENAAPVAEALVAADTDGLASHGLSRLPFYADQAASGKVNGQAAPDISARGAVVNVDARCGFAYRAINEGNEQGIAQARNSGIAAVAIGNSHHFGVAGYHVERVARQGLIALAFGNTPAAMAPWGGSSPVFGTNPVAFAAPRDGAEPLVIDLSLSKVARGKIMMADKAGEAIPEGWALDTDGNPTTDTKTALAGSMVPLGDAKGAALALMVEILTAGLTGSNFAFEASSFFDAEGKPPRVAQLFLLLNPEFFGGTSGFSSRMTALLEAIARQQGTRLPGERRLAARAKAKDQGGISIPDVLHQQLLDRRGQG